MIDVETSDQDPSEVFDKGAKKKRGLMDLLGFGGGKKDDEDIQEVASQLPVEDDYYDEPYLYDDNNTFNPPSTQAGKKNLLALLDDDEDSPPPIVDEPPEHIPWFEDEEDEDYDDEEEEEEEPPIETPLLNIQDTLSHQQVVEKAVQEEAESVETRVDILASAGYTEIIEALTTKVMLQHEIPNISLESFGAVAATYEPSTLTISTFGKHKFAGNPLTDKQKIILFLQIEGLVEKARKENKDKVILSATQQVLHEGIRYKTLLLSDDLLEDYMNAYNRLILTNGDVAPLEELAVIINL